METIVCVITFLFFCGLTLPISNALVSIATCLALLLVIAKAVKCKKNGLKDFSLPIAISLLIFVGSLYVSSYMLGDKESISYAGKLTYWMLPIVLAYLVTVYVPKAIESIGMASGIAMIVTGVVAVYQFTFQGMIRVSSVYSHPNHLASMIDIVLPLTVMYMAYLIKNEKQSNIKLAVIGAAIISGFVAMILSGSRGSILGVTAGLFICLALCCLRNCEYKKLIAVVVLCACAGYGLQYFDNKDLKGIHRRYDMERVYLIQSSYNMWKDHQMYGVGLTNWAKEYQSKYILPQAKEPKLDMPHNILAYFFSTTGLVGGIGFCLFMLIIFGYLFLNLKYANGGVVAFCLMWAFLAISIHGQVDVGLHNKFVMRAFCGALGFAMAYINVRELDKNTIMP